MQIDFILVTGIFSAMNSVFDTIAYQEEKSTTVSLLEYIELVYAFIADTLLFR
jgi:hypothetical protein